jgi:DNA-directed RNA polymerase specialized sigma24 family protein
MLAASVQWPADGVPDNPRGWLITVAAHRVTDEIRSDSARRRREETAAALVPADEFVAPAPGDESLSGQDDTLALLFMCCHPAISPPSQLALTLRAIGGLTTAQIAHAFLVPEATMAQRISRAKQRIKAAGASFAMPPADERTERLQVVLHVLYPSKAAQPASPALLRDPSPWHSASHFEQRICYLLDGTCIGASRKRSLACRDGPTPTAERSSELRWPYEDISFSCGGRGCVGVSARVDMRWGTRGDPVWDAVEHDRLPALQDRVSVVIAAGECQRLDVGSAALRTRSMTPRVLHRSDPTSIPIRRYRCRGQRDPHTLHPQPAPSSDRASSR